MTINTAKNKQTIAETSLLMGGAASAGGITASAAFDFAELLPLVLLLLFLLPLFAELFLPVLLFFAVPTFLLCAIWKVPFLAQ